MPDTTILTSDETAEIEAHLKAWDAGEVSKQTFPASWAKVQALCQTVRALRAENEKWQRAAGHWKARHEVAESELAALTQERDALREKLNDLTARAEKVLIFLLN